MEDIKKEIFDNFNEFIINQKSEPDEVCLFIKSLLEENGYEYRPTGCYGKEWILKDNLIGCDT